MVTIAFTGGGTGGHIFPGLAVASALARVMPCRIFWIGSRRGMDRALVEAAGLPFFGIPSGKLRRYPSLRNLADAFRVLAGCFAAFSILRRERPALLFSKGGFVSSPPAAAAALLGIPVFTHESDFSPGLATRINLRFARRVFTAFPETASFLPASARPRVTMTGNPIRRDFFGADPALGRAFLGTGPDVPVLLVLGGSLGARRLNELVRECLPALTEFFFVAHQTGPGKGDGGAGAGSSGAGSSGYAGERYRAWDFIGEEMPHVVAAAGLVLCRSGAGTLWECASLGKPMILLPLSGPGTRGDQVENARSLERAGAALVLDGDAGAGELVRAVRLLAEDGPRREALGRAASAFAPGDAAGIIAGIIAEEVGGAGSAPEGAVAAETA